MCNADDDGDAELSGHRLAGTPLLTSKNLYVQDAHLEDRHIYNNTNVDDISIHHKMATNNDAERAMRGALNDRS